MRTHNDQHGDSRTRGPRSHLHTWKIAQELFPTITPLHPRVRDTSIPMNRILVHGERRGAPILTTTGLGERS